jgi:hypothetical protein
MNTTIKLLFGTVAAGLLFSFFKKKKAALENIAITKIDVAIDLDKTKNYSYLKLFYNIRLHLFNSAEIAVNIKSIEAIVFLNGIEFANINSNLSTVVEAKKSKTINIEASVNSLNVINSIIDIITEGKANIKVKGSLMTDLGLIEFSKETIV